MIHDTIPTVSGSPTEIYLFEVDRRKDFVHRTDIRYDLVAHTKTAPLTQSTSSGPDSLVWIQ